MGQSQTKSYKYQPSGGAQCGQFVSVIGVVLGAVAVFLDQLTSKYSDSDDTTVDGYCGWNASGSWLQSDGIYSAYYYEYYCSGDGADVAKYLDPDNEDYCSTQTLGQVWLAFSIIALFSALSAVGAVQVNYDKSSKCADWFATICGILAVVCWCVADNPVCYDSDAVDDEEQRLGPSIYLMIVASVCWVVGGLIS